MPSFDVAHIQEQGQNMIIIPLDWTFGSKTLQEQNEIARELQLRANNAGLAGTVVPVWESGGRMMSLCPDLWRGFFQSISMDFVAMNINKQLFW